MVAETLRRHRCAGGRAGREQHGDEQQAGRKEDRREELVLEPPDAPAQGGQEPGEGDPGERDEIERDERRVADLHARGGVADVAQGDRVQPKQHERRRHRRREDQAGDARGPDRAKAGLGRSVGRVHVGASLHRGTTPLARGQRRRAAFGRLPQGRLVARRVPCGMSSSDEGQ